MPLDTFKASDALTLGVELELQLVNTYDHDLSSSADDLLARFDPPLVPEQIAAFCADKRAVLVIEEGQPEFIEQDIATQLRRADLQTRLHGKDLLPMGGEYTAEILLKGLTAFAAEHLPLLDLSSAQRFSTELAEVRERALVELGGGVPARPPNFCTGCPERPVFAALKLVEREVGKLHISTDIGCHSFATFEPFSFGNSILGYGMSMASSAAVKNFSAKRPIAIMGDGGFWHNGLLSGVSSTLLNQGDGVLVMTELQRAGGKRLPVADFLRGFTIAAGQVLRTPVAPA